MKRTLREEKRISTMKQIQGAALTLFSEAGFSKTTVEDIARHAGVGPATVYRHFDTKERIMLWDEYEGDFVEQMHALIAAEGLAPALAALGAEVDAGMDPEQTRRHKARMRLVASEPALLAQSYAGGLDIASMVASALALRGKRSEPSPADRAMGHVMAGLFHSLMMDWAQQDDGGPRFTEMLADSLAALRTEVPGE